MSDLKQSIFQKIIDKKFTKANSDFIDIMKDKTQDAIKTFKNTFVFIPKSVETEEPEEEK